VSASAGERSAVARDAAAGDVAAATQPSAGRRLPVVLAVLAGICLVWNGVLYLAALWAQLWWLALFGNFLLVVLAAERIGREVPP
jgi:hypothetical protein